MGDLARAAAGVAAAVLAAQIVPAATWLPDVRRYFPALAGVGRRDHVALTFDDGPDPAGTPALLDVLDQHDARATFFLIGERAARHPELTRRILDQGHEIGVHGWTHHYALVSTPRLSRCVAAIFDACGKKPQWYRPAYGVLSAGCLAEARLARLRPVLWTAWAKDWRADASPAGILALLSEGIVGGATLLLHDESDQRAPGSWKATLAALPGLLKTCEEKGLRVGPLREHDVGRTGASR